MSNFSTPSKLSTIGGSTSAATPPLPTPRRSFRATSSGSGSGGVGGIPPSPQAAIRSTSAASSVGSAIASAPLYSASPGTPGRKTVTITTPGTPPPPVMGATNHTSMTIDEMRILHQRALQQAESKRTELRLVLASRYRELVGSSDEVLRMKERATELHELVHHLPELLEKLRDAAKTSNKTSSMDLGGETKEDTVDETLGSATSFDLGACRRQLSDGTRSVHRALDRNEVHRATLQLLQVFSMINAYSGDGEGAPHRYPVAHQLATQDSVQSLKNLSMVPMATKLPPNDPATMLFQAQIRMIYYQLESLPQQIIRMSNNLLLQAAIADRKGTNDGVEKSAAALAALHLLQPVSTTNMLLETYYDAKSKLLLSLLNQLRTEASDQAEEILSQIVVILQHDIIVHPYLIFIKREFPTSKRNKISVPSSVFDALPWFDPGAVQLRCCKFLATHLPLIRTKVKSVLVTIAGTTASALGQIRQSLYDKTDGSRNANNSNFAALWDEAVSAVVDLRQVLPPGEQQQQQAKSLATSSAFPTAGPKLSLWSALFSQTFSSLVHSLLTTAFTSVHAKVTSTLRTSLLEQAPPLADLASHEAHRNTLVLATHLNQSLVQVSDDAHNLLVHAEEREESERRLRQSLYVQTCEILGRLLCEVRRILDEPTSLSLSSTSDGTRELIVGRLCHFLQFQLTSLPKLLDPASSPAIVQSMSTASTTAVSGMISFVDLESAFTLADDNDDGLISLEEALQAVESAFSGTQFHGSEMVKESLLVSSSAASASSGIPAPPPSTGVPVATPDVNLLAPPPGAITSINLTLDELVLLTARGLRHEAPRTALDTVHHALEDLVLTCLTKWAQAALADGTETLRMQVERFWLSAQRTTDEEWRLYHSATGNNSGMAGSSVVDSTSPMDALAGVSPYVVGFVMEVVSALNRTVTPADSIVFGTPVTTTHRTQTLTETVRSILLQESLKILVSTWSEFAKAKTTTTNLAPTALVQYYVDVTFIKFCYVERNRYDLLLSGDAQEELMQSLTKIVNQADKFVSRACSRATLMSLPSKTAEHHHHVGEVCDLFLTSLFGAQTTSLVASAGVMGSTSTHSLYYPPLASSRRFALLPIQSDRTLTDLQLKGVYKKEEQERRQKEAAAAAAAGSGGVMGLGFLSNMLKKK